MASWVFCNRCFQPPHRTSCFSLTNCGHVYCDVCLDKEHTDADIRALFMGIDDLCRKYSKETFQVSEFQEKHRRRLLAFYREKCEIVTADSFQHNKNSGFEVESMQVDLTPSPARKPSLRSRLARQESL
ncbi:probable E3 SUMO-protein ligase RNF212 isoform X2 [Prionailurus iriomotensis]